MWIAERKVDTISKLGSFDPSIFQDLVLYDYRFGTIFLVFGLLAELFSFLMWWKKYRYIIVAMVLAMHIGIVLTMNIFFHASTYFLILLALPWHEVIDRVHSFIKSFQAQQTKVA